jgi:long-chain acyl-CoA synthetase
MIEFFNHKIREYPHKEALVHQGRSISYGELSALIDTAATWLKAQGIPSGAVVSFDGDYSAPAIALLFALAENRNIIIPLSTDSKLHFDEFREIGETEFDISINGEAFILNRTGRQSNNQLYEKLRESGSPGVVLFSSGSTGKSKGIVQNLDKLMTKFQQPRKGMRMLIFLQLDHIGGINSLLYSVANQGTIIVAESRAPEQVCRSIEKFQVELLPTSPTFLNLLILSNAHQQFDLSSLGLITYGTEPMQESTLKKLASALPGCQFQQTYGLSEVGILRSKSQSSDSLWMKVGGDEFETKIQNGTLWIRSDSAMLGYLNAPNPFDDEGFLDTGDMVEQQGEWIRILGRKSEIINVGGYKVYPAEVESTLLEMPNVLDVVVFGDVHPITGKIVRAKFKLQNPETIKSLKSRMLQFCKDRLPSYKIPGKISITEESTYNERFKRMRRENRELT